MLNIGIHGPSLKSPQDYVRLLRGIELAAEPRHISVFFGEINKKVAITARTSSWWSIFSGRRVTRFLR
jgi:hypothetical protein